MLVLSYLLVKKESLVRGGVCSMSRVCDICGKGGNKATSIQRRGKAKKKGGVGRNITSRSKRTQRPNLQKVKAIVDGSPKRIKVCTQCLKSGKVERAY